MAWSKPQDMFDRDFEWDELTRFAGNRRSAGHTGHRLRAAAPGQDLSRWMLSPSRRTGSCSPPPRPRKRTPCTSSVRRSPLILDEPTPFRFTGWDEAITRLMRLAVNGPKPVVIDEFPFLAKATPALPSLIQRALEPAAQRRNTPVRLLLCGSALSFMGKLLAGSAPLRGRAGLELLVPTLDFRLAREFWGIGDLRTAVLTNAIVGGTPAYRREFAQDDSRPDPTISTPGYAAQSSTRADHCSARPVTSLPRNPTFTTPRSTTRYSRRSPRATPPAAGLPTTSSASPPTSRTHWASFMTPG